MGQRVFNKLTDEWGEPFGKDDVITCMCDLDARSISFMKNDTSLGKAFTIPQVMGKEGSALFPSLYHSANVKFDVDFVCAGDTWHPTPEGFRPMKEANEEPIETCCCTALYDSRADTSDGTLRGGVLGAAVAPFYSVRAVLECTVHLGREPALRIHVIRFALVPLRPCQVQAPYVLFCKRVARPWRCNWKKIRNHSDQCNPLDQLVWAMPTRMRAEMTTWMRARMRADMPAWMRARMRAEITTWMRAEMTTWMRARNAR
eukprot:gene8567-biopygen3303